MQAPPSWLIVLMVVCVLVGIFFRFYAIDRKGFWQDEAWTAAHITGHRIGDAGKHLRHDSAGVSAGQVMKTQHFDSNSSLVRTVRMMIETDPQHTPLFTLIDYGWARCFGDSVASLRFPAAIIGVLAIPFFYWTCLGLFRSHTAAAVGTSLFAVAPFQVLYSQEAREYSLFTLTTLISLVALFAAMREPSRRVRWIVYALTVALGLWTYLLFIFSLPAHAAWVLAQRNGKEPEQRRRTTKQFVIAVSIGIAAYLPWAAIILIRHRAMKETTNWLTEELSIPALALRWVRAFASNFVDFHQRLGSSVGASWERPLIIVVLVAILATTYVLLRGARKRWMILLLVIVPFLAMAGPDLVLGGRRSAQPRYLIVSYLGVSLAVTALLSLGLTSTRRSARAIAAVVLLMLVAAGIASILYSGPRDRWWHKHGGLAMQSIGRAISAAPGKSLVLFDADGANFGNAVALSRYIRDDVRLRLDLAENMSNACRVGLADYDHVFLAELTADRAAAVRATGLTVTELPDADGIAWRVELSASTQSTTQGSP